MELPISLEDYEKETGLEGQEAATRWEKLMDLYRFIIRQREESNEDNIV